MFTDYNSAARNIRNSFKRIAKLTQCMLGKGTDNNSASGIQVWSRFTPQSTEDYTQLGFIDGSNAKPNNENNQPYFAAKIAYRAGYNLGASNHKPYSHDACYKQGVNDYLKGLSYDSTQAYNLAGNIGAIAYGNGYYDASTK